MTAVVAAADAPSTGCVPGAAATRLPLGRPPRGIAKDQFFEAVSDLLDREETVVCVYPSWRERSAQRNIRLARSLLGSERVVGVRSELPPLAFSLTVDLLAHLANYLPPGILIAMVDRLSSQLVAGAWLNSVTKFQYAPTSLGEHMRSYLPSTAFVAVIAPQPTVHRAGAGRVLRWRPPDPVHVLLMSDDGDQNWARARLLPELRPAATRSVPVQPASADYWGTKRVLEFVAFSAHPDALTSLVRNVRYRPCSWCGELVTSDPCPFCRMSAKTAAVHTFHPSHALPESQRLPTTPLVAAAPGGPLPDDPHPRSEKR